jgi:hypothetical protein
MSWVAVAATAVTAYGSYQQKKSAEKGTQAGIDGQLAGIDEQRRQFDLTRQDMAPWMQQGQWALGQRRAAMEGDWSGFMNSPDYKYALQEGLGAIDSRAAARGGLFGGGNTRDAIKFGQGMALQNYNNYDNRLAGISNTGQNTAGTLGQFGSQMANNVSNAYGNMGQIRQSGYNNTANMWGNLAQQGVGMLGQYYGGR